MVGFKVNAGADVPVPIAATGQPDAGCINAVGTAPAVVAASDGYVVAVAVITISNATYAGLDNVNDSAVEISPAASDGVTLPEPSRVHDVPVIVEELYNAAVMVPPEGVFVVYNLNVE